MITAERDYVAYYYNLLLLYGSLYTLTRIALENENYDRNGNITVERDGEYNNGYVYESVLVGTSNDGRDIYRLNWAIGIEEQPKVRADVYQKSYEYDERDRLLYARDNFSLYSIYRYDESGERSNKYNYFSEEEDTICKQVLQYKHQQS